MPTEASRRAYSLTQRQIVADISTLKEDRPAAVAALDGAVGVVPLVDPADGHGGSFDHVEMREVSTRCDAAQQVECAKERAVSFEPATMTSGWPVRPQVVCLSQNP